MKKNKHHVLWPKNDYNHLYEPFILRTRPQMIHNVPVVDHNDLHKDIDPLAPMSVELARIALQHLDTQNNELSRMDSFLSIVERFNNISCGVGRVAIEAGNFAEHFGAQLGYFGRED